MEYIRLILGITLGIALTRMLIRNSILMAYIPHWKSQLVHMFRRE